MLDRSLLSPAQFEYIVLSDTHYMRAPANQPLEMESRRRQSARALHALRLIAAGDPDLVVHLGDLVQEFPGYDGFETSLGEALSQIAGCGLDPRYVAGNHDVGDKPDPTMPTDWVTEQSLARYHELVSPSWQSWDHAGWHFVVLNSQIMNGPLPDEEEQWRWLESDLEGSAGTPVVVFMHLAPFLVECGEPALSHYDNIAEPARGRLLALIERFDVRLLFAGHSHFQFFNRHDKTRMYVAPSTSFTRPGFSESFSSPAPPEQGRDDRAKLGFFLLRGQDDAQRVHRIRTDGREDEPDPEHAVVVTRLPLDLPRSPLGVVARHPIAPTGEVPVAWPSLIRQPMRNDYPLLACLELGARHVKVPGSDLLNEGQLERLRMLRDEGVAVTATWIWSAGLDLAREVTAGNGALDSIEVQIPGGLLPDPETLRDIRRDATVPVTIAPLIAREIVPGKQHARARIGYRAAELSDLAEYLAHHDLELDRITMRVDSALSPWDVMQDAAASLPLPRVSGVDWLVELGTLDAGEQAERVAEALFAAALQPGCRVFLDPLMDLDRTMDVTLGLIDRQSNPHPSFNVARMLNTILFRGEAYETWDVQPSVNGVRCIGLRSDAEQYCLALGDNEPDKSRDILGSLRFDGKACCYDLERATISSLDPDEYEVKLSAGRQNRPLLFAMARA